MVTEDKLDGTSQGVSVCLSFVISLPAKMA